MAQDKYNALWVSHSSIGDYLKCPRAYFLHNIYRSKDNRKINIVSSFLSLGSAVHETLESLANYKAEERFSHPLEASFEENWKKFSGKTGGFKNEEEEENAKERARQMILMVEKNPGPLAQKTVKLRPSSNNMPPNFFLSEEENIILNGKIDWLEYIPDDDSIRIIDFKTGKNDEDGQSLQMPIYILLLNALQKRKVSGASYWYLERSDKPSPVALQDTFSAREKILSIARQIKSAKEQNIFECHHGKDGCFACQPYEKILRNEAEFVGLGGYNQEMYLI
ncbi:MAG: PD-(D/E)XK nuclease family protein [bacterium]|nr:PD-(D/E)XK nuclease family protein [bacterium]